MAKEKKDKKNKEKEEYGKGTIVLKEKQGKKVETVMILEASYGEIKY